MDKELQNALAFCQPAPEGWFDSTARRMEAGGEWIWLTLQGDFNEHPTTGQVVAGTLISVIPLVDQLCDMRDLIANSRKIEQERDNLWAWVALVLTLVGCFPVLGSVTKGGIKVLLLSARKGMLSTAARGGRVGQQLDEAIQLLDRFLAMPAVRQTLRACRIGNAYHYLEDKLRRLMATLTPAALLNVLDPLLASTREMLGLVAEWGPASLYRPVQALGEQLTRLRSQANTMLANALAPATDYLEALANRLRVEGDNLYRAHVGNNYHVLGTSPERARAELALLERERPNWVDKGIGAHYPALGKLDDDYVKYIDNGWPDIRKIDNRKHPLDGAFKTFDDSLHASELPPGTRLYRVVDAGSGDNSICWMREEEFLKLTAKSDWRRRFAVWKSWNENGEYLVYTVPPHSTLKVWEGRAATQLNRANKMYSLEGGAVQIVVDPAQLKKEFVSARRPTGWGYQDVPADPVYPYLGLPYLETTHKWNE